MGFVFIVKQLSDVISQHSLLQVDKIVTRSETGIKLAFQLFLKSQEFFGLW